MEKVQIIERDGKPEYAVIPFSDYQHLRLLADAMQDIQAYDAAMADTGEAVPHDILVRLVAGESPVKVWREYRGLTLAALAKEAGIDAPSLAQIEAGGEPGSVAVLKRLALALGVELDDLVTADTV